MDNNALWRMEGDEGEKRDVQEEREGKKGWRGEEREGEKRRYIGRKDGGGKRERNNSIANMEHTCTHADVHVRT